MTAWWIKQSISFYSFAFICEERSGEKTKVRTATPYWAKKHFSCRPWQIGAKRVWMTNDLFELSEMNYQYNLLMPRFCFHVLNNKKMIMWYVRYIYHASFSLRGCLTVCNARFILILLPFWGSLVIFWHHNRMPRFWLIPLSVWNPFSLSFHLLSRRCSQDFENANLTDQVLVTSTDAAWYVIRVHSLLCSVATSYIFWIFNAGPLPH